MSEVLDSPSLHEVEGDKEKNSNTDVPSDITHIVVKVCLDVCASGDNRVSCSGSGERAGLIRPKNYWVLGKGSDIMGDNIGSIACET